MKRIFAGVFVFLFINNAFSYTCETIRGIKPDELNKCFENLKKLDTSKSLDVEMFLRKEAKEPIDCQCIRRFWDYRLEYGWDDWDQANVLRFLQNNYGMKLNNFDSFVKNFYFDACKGEGVFHKTKHEYILAEFEEKPDRIKRLLDKVIEAQMGDKFNLCILNVVASINVKPDEKKALLHYGIERSKLYYNTKFESMVSLLLQEIEKLEP